jgi:ATP-dependent RNA helicase DeaD
LFSEANTEEDLVLARAMLAERSPEDIAAALARLYRARLPSPEDMLEPEQGHGRAREDRGPRKDSRPARDDNRDARPPSKHKKSSRDGMAEGSVWFRAAIGKRKNAEARWLLPMICRRGGIEKQSIGAIRIHDTTTEFEISATVAESFAAQVKRPDKEDNIRIELMSDAPASPAAFAKPTSPKPWDGPKHKGKETGRAARHNDRPREERDSKPHGKPHREGGHRFDKESGPKKKAEHRTEQGNWPDNSGRPQHPGGSPGKPAFKKKPKKKDRRG